MATTTAGRIIGLTGSVVKQKLWPLVGLWAVFFAISIALVFLFVAVAGLGAFMTMNGSGEGGLGQIGAGMTVAMILFYLGYLLLYGAQISAMTAMAAPNSAVTFSQAIGIGFQSAPSVLGVLLLFIVAYFLLAIPAALLAGLLSMAGTAGIVMLAVALVPIMTWLACRLFLANAVIPIEGIRNPVRAISRSWSLTRGNVLPIFLSMLAFGAAMLVAFLILLFPFRAMASGGQVGAGPGVAITLLIVLLFFVFSVAIAIFSGAFPAAIHCELAEPQSEFEVFS